MLKESVIIVDEEEDIQELEGKIDAITFNASITSLHN